MAGVNLDGEERLIRLLTPAKPVYDFFRFDVESFEHENFEAFPGLDLINVAIRELKGVITNGERECGAKKICAYLGYRLITYSGIPLALNLVSIVLSGLAILVLIPITACCTKDNKALRWAWVHLQGSLGHTAQSLWDLTTDIRLLTCGCCALPSSICRQI